MGRAYRGPYARPSSAEVPYATATVWGTGIDPIHSYYGEGPPLRMLGRAGTIGSSPVGNDHSRDREYQTPSESSGFNPPEEMTWGYPVDYGPDSFGMGADAPISLGDTAPAVIQYLDSRPRWGENDELRRDINTMPSWGKNGRVMRAIRAGSHRYRADSCARQAGQGGCYQPVSAEPSNSNPTETVSEGWLNKVTSFTAYAEPSDPSQYEVQTSMRQRFGKLDNQRAMARGADEARTAIESRVMAMVEKVYSTDDRSYDMFPYQIDQIERPFRYRTAGVGPAEWLIPNEYNPVTPIQRTPPANPSAGVPEVSGDYGYTGEDTMYYG